MKLSELLDELREGILNDRTDRTAGTSDYLWTDARLVRYINEAQRRMAVRGLLLRDGTTDEVTLVDLVEGQTEYTLHESVLAVISAKIEGEIPDLQRVGHAMLAGYRLPDDRLYDTVQYAGLSPGNPLAYLTDEELDTDDEGTLSNVVLRVYPEPDAEAATKSLRLRVARRPLCDLTVSDLNASPEIPADHHLDMLDWAAYLALRIVDDDAGWVARANEFRASFEAHLQEARQSAIRKMFAPTPQRHGQRGWAWER